MRRALGVAACAVLLIAGCGGVAELDSSETDTVNAANSAVADATASGSLKPGDQAKLEALMVLCHEKPLAESDGESMRELITRLAPELKSADPKMSRRLKRFATDGCN